MNEPSVSASNNGPLAGQRAHIVQSGRGLAYHRL